MVTVMAVVVPHFRQILLVIYNGKTTTNEIYRNVAQTGLPGLGYKQKILYAINELEKGGLIMNVFSHKPFKPGKK